MHVRSAPASVPGPFYSLTREVLGCYIFSALERADIADEAPDRVAIDESAPRRHAVGTSLRDGFVDFGDGTTEMPASVDERRGHRPGTVAAVTVDAVVGDVKLRAHRGRRGVALERIAQRERVTRDDESGLHVLVVRDEARCVLGRELL